MSSGPRGVQKSAQAPIGVTSLSSSQPSGLDASIWAPKPTLRDLPGLRRTRDWDDSGYYTHPIAMPFTRIPLNMLPQYAWNGGVKPRSNSNASTSAKAPAPHLNARPVGSKDAVTTVRPTPVQNATVGISEQVPNTSSASIHANVAGTTKSVAQSLVKTPQKSEVRNVAGNNPPKDSYVPPHLRIAEPRTQLLEPEKGQKTANNKTSPTTDSHDSAERRKYHVVAPSAIGALSPVAESSPSKLSQGNPEASACDAGSFTLVATTDPELKLAPHLRVPKSLATPALTESQSLMKNQSNAKTTAKLESEKGSKKAGMNGFSKSVFPEDDSKAANGQMNVATGKNDVASQSKGQQKDKQPANEVRAWYRLAEVPHPFVGWDDNRAESPEDWDTRSHVAVPPTKEQKSALESWVESSESAFHEASTYVDTALPEFTLGTGLIHDGSLSAGLPDQAHSTRRLWNDPLTMERSEQTAQSMIEEHNAQRQAEITEAKKQQGMPEAPLTKQEQRQRRQILRQQNEELAKIPNPYKPKADIYIRPAQIRDLPQIVEIYNHYIKTSAVALELDPLDQATWRHRMDDCRREGFEMYVAVQKAAQGNGRNRRDNCEPIYGFAYAEDQNGKRSSTRFAAIAQVYVSWMHLRIGVGRCLLDRVMAMLNINHHHKQGVDWVGDPPLKQREIKKVLIEIPYWDDSDEERAIFRMEQSENTGQMNRASGWKARFLESVQFEYSSTLRGVGFKQASLDKGKT